MRKRTITKRREGLAELAAAMTCESRFPELGMLELGEWYPEGETALLESLNFLDFADGQEEQVCLHTDSGASMRQNASLGERCEDGDTVTGDSSPKRRPDCALYPTSPHATGELGARAFAGSIHRVRVISSSTASLRQGQSRVHSTACDRPPRGTEQMKQSVSESTSF